jgi:putative phosphoesterase
MHVNAYAARAHATAPHITLDHRTTTHQMTPPDRVAIFSDIHANLPALHAVLADIEAEGIAELYCGGDLVGYGPHPNEVCALIAERAIPTIYGNYDYAIARDEHDCGCAYVTQHDRDLGQESVEWTLANTDVVAKAFMRALPFDLRFRIGAADVHLVHGSPRKVNEYLFEDKPLSLYERLAAAEDAQVLVFGHTHKPWHDVRGGVLFVNSGSVGKPKDGDPRAGWLELRAVERDVEAIMHRVPYDADAVAAQVRAAGLPGEFADKLLLAA